MADWGYRLDWLSQCHCLSADYRVAERSEWGLVEEGEYPDLRMDGPWYECQYVGR